MGRVSLPASVVAAHAQWTFEVQWHGSEPTCDLIAAPEQLSLYCNAGTDAICDAYVDEVMFADRCAARQPQLRQARSSARIFDVHGQSSRRGQLVRMSTSRHPNAGAFRNFPVR